MFSQLLRTKTASALVMAGAMALPIGVAVAGLPSANVAASSTASARDVPSALGAGATASAPADRSAFDVRASVIDLEQAAIAEVQAAGGVAVDGGGTCAASDLVVSYEDPGSGWASGAFVGPLGPAPDESTTGVNGVVRCADSHHAYVGFEAVLDAGTWVIGIVPDPAGGFASEQEEAKANTPDVAPKPKPVVTAGPIVGLVDGPEIEGYAQYQGQSTCDPTPKPGTLALRNLLLARYPVTTSLGISRDCSVGAQSEHKEGRAFDWGANVGNPAQKAAVESFLTDLFATDSYGHAHALARRMGVMYVIWNRQIWSAYSASSGWRPYSGSSPHTDHVHISLSWAGARAETSFWSGTVVPGLPDKPSAAKGASSSSRPAAGSSAPSTSTTWRPRRRSTSTTLTDTSLVTATTVRRFRSTTTTAAAATVPTSSSMRTTTTTVRRFPTTTTSTTARPTTTTSAPTTSTSVRRWWSTTTTTARATTTTVSPPTTAPPQP